MPNFRGPVVIYGTITVEGEDSLDADEKAQLLTNEEILELLNKERGGINSLSIEVFEKEFPYEV